LFYFAHHVLYKHQTRLTSSPLDVKLGGMRDGAYVNSAEADNPTIEYFPSKGPQIGLNILKESLPCNLYPLTWLLPSGNLFIQSNLKASNFDWRAGVEHNLPEIPHAVRVYPASGAAAMLPLTPQNNWTATILFCGGVNLKPKQWMQNPTWNVAAYQTDDTCVSIRPDDESPQWVEEGEFATPAITAQTRTMIIKVSYADFSFSYLAALCHADKMYEGRTLSNFIILPDGRLFHFNGMATGTAGYGNTSWAVGQSFSDNPVMSSAYYDSSAPQGSRWSRPDSLKPMAVERGYHSSATLMADGSIFNAGSNPNVDYIPYKGYVDERGRTYQYPTEYRVEMFYPDYFDEERPKPGSLPKTLSYGGEHFDISLSVKDDLKGNASLIDTVKVVVMRTGYSTHGMNMGMRMVQLNSTWELQEGGGSDQAVIHMAQMPPNAGVMAPGPALLYVVVDGIPSIGVDVMIGNGQTGEQEILPVEDMAGNLAQSGILASSSSGNSSSSGGKTPGTQQGGASSNNTASDKGAAAKAFSTSMQVAMTVLLSASVAILVL
jgi:hypothetical protein